MINKALENGISMASPNSRNGGDATLNKETMTDETIERPPATSRTSLSSNKIQTVTSRTFSRLVLEAEGPIAVEFMSYGCVHCRAMEPSSSKWQRW